MNQPEETKLLPCPFCGSVDVLLQNFIIEAGISCGQCGAHMLKKHTHHRRNDGIETVAKSWNTRTTPSQPSPADELAALITIGAEKQGIKRSCTCGDDSDPSVQHRQHGLPCYKIVQLSPIWLKDAAEEIHKASARAVSNGNYSLTINQALEILICHAKCST